MKKELFNGCCTALVTPFKDKKVDYDALKKLIMNQVHARVSAIVILGTTGEPCTITGKDRDEIIAFCRKEIPNSVKMIVGTGGNNTSAVIRMSRRAQMLGADGLLIVTPYYNKCTDTGLFLHYNKIAKSVKIPIIIYNVPSRTGVNISPEMALKLSTINNIVGIKESSGNMAQINKLFSLLKNKMAIYCGEDELNYSFLCLGATGIISVLSNIVPKDMQRLCEYCFNNKYRMAKDIHYKYYNLSKKLFLETNPIPVKTVLEMMGLCSSQMRLPLCNIAYENKKIIRDELQFLGLIKNDNL